MPLVGKYGHWNPVAWQGGIQEHPHLSVVHSWASAPYYMEHSQSSKTKEPVDTILQSQLQVGSRVKEDGEERIISVYWLLSLTIKGLLF